MLILHGMPHTRTLRISWLLEEMQLPWQYLFVDLFQGEHRSERYTRKNPIAKVPLLQDGDIQIGESLAIAMYLCEAYAPAFRPKAATAQSALHDQWLSFVISDLEQGLWTRRKHSMTLPPDKRIAEVLPTAEWEFMRAVDSAEQMLHDSEFLCGSQISIADIFLCHTLNWARTDKIALPAKLEHYRQRLSARPQLKQALDKELAAAKAS